jgi:hypothetical protein
MGKAIGQKKDGLAAATLSRRKVYPILKQSNDCIEFIGFRSENFISILDFQPFARV